MPRSFWMKGSGSNYLAEHGFAALTELKDAETTILWDAGISSTALTENVERMEVDLTIDIRS